MDLDYFEVSGSRETWNEVIEQIFGHHRLSQNDQCIYRLDDQDLTTLSISQRRPACVLRKVDRDLVSESSLRNLEFLIGKLEQFWGSVGAFLDRGIGYSVIYQNAIISLCFSAFVAQNTHTVDIETVGESRRRGFAEIAAHAYLTDCIESGVALHWDCMQENKASVALAEKLGLRKVDEYVLYYFPLL
jgi:hypothetical protein